MSFGLVYGPQTKVAREYYDTLAELADLLAGNVEKLWPDHGVAECIIEAAEHAKRYVDHVKEHGEPSVVILEER